MIWFVDNCWWIVLAVFAVVVGLAVALFVINRKEKKIRQDFKEKVLFLENVDENTQTSDVVAEKDDILVETNVNNAETAVEEPKVEEKEIKKTTKKSSQAKTTTAKKTTKTSSGKKPASKTSKSSTSKKSATKKTVSTAKKSTSKSATTKASTVKKTADEVESK